MFFVFLFVYWKCIEDQICKGLKNIISCVNFECSCMIQTGKYVWCDVIWWNCVWVYGLYGVLRFTSFKEFKTWLLFALIKLETNITSFGWWWNKYVYIFYITFSFHRTGSILCCIDLISCIILPIETLIRVSQNKVK